MVFILLDLKTLQNRLFMMTDSDDAIEIYCSEQFSCFLRPYTELIDNQCLVNEFKG